MSKYTITDIQYHRNGISGQGFFAVEFDLHEGGGTFFGLVAVMPHVYDEETDDHRLKADETYVISPGDISEGWRGDRIGWALIPTVEANRDAAFPTLYPHARDNFPLEVNDD